MTRPHGDGLTAAQRSALCRLDRELERWCRRQRWRSRALACLRWTCVGFAGADLYWGGMVGAWYRADLDAAAKPDPGGAS